MDVLSLRVVARHQEKTARDLYARLFEAMSLQDAKRVLGFPPNASPSPEEISKAYKHKAIENHPDRGGDHEKMVEVNVAKDILDGKQRPDGARGRPSAPSGPPRKTYEDYVREKQEADAKKVRTGDSFAEAKTKAPHGVTWKFRSGLMMGKESAFTKEQGLNSYVACWVCYGQSASQHVFMLVEHAIPNPYTDALFDSWSMSTVETYPLSHPIEKLAPKAIKAIVNNGKLTSGMLKLNSKFMGLETLSEVAFEHSSGGVALKDILIGLGFASGAASDRKVVVEMVGKQNEARTKASRDRARATGGWVSTLDAWQWYDFTLFVNGKSYPLSEATVANLAKQGAHGNLFWLAVYSPAKYDYGQRRVLTRIPRYGSEILKMVEDSLSGEPAELTVSLLKAIEAMETPKTAHEHTTEEETMDPLALKVAARFVSSKTAGESAVKPKNVPDRHQLKILIDTVKNPAKGFLGGPDAEESEEILRTKFKYTDAEIEKLKTADAKQAIMGRLPDNHIDRYPSGKWGFVGRVDGRLMYEGKGGKPLSPEEAKEMSQTSNPAMYLSTIGGKRVVFDSAYDAFMAAKKLGQGVTVAPHMLDKYPEMADALEKSGVKHKIH